MQVTNTMCSADESSVFQANSPPPMSLVAATVPPAPNPSAEPTDATAIFNELYHQRLLEYATHLFHTTPNMAAAATWFQNFQRFNPILANVPAPTTNRFFMYSDEPKPQHSYIGLIAMAILSSAEKKMVLSDIYQYILDNYTYFRNRGPGWRNSIRHNLSLNDCFVKAGRSANGKGHYWAIHPANIEDFKKGDFRRRRAQRKVRKHMGLSVPDEEDDSPSPTPPPQPVYSPLVMGPLGVPFRPLAAGPRRQFDVESLLAPEHCSGFLGSPADLVWTNVPVPTAVTPPFAVSPPNKSIVRDESPRSIVNPSQLPWFVAAENPEFFRRPDDFPVPMTAHSQLNSNCGKRDWKHEKRSK